MQHAVADTHTHTHCVTTSDTIPSPLARKMTSVCILKLKNGGKSFYKYSVIWVEPSGHRSQTTTGIIRESKKHRWFDLLSKELVVISQCLVLVF